MPALPCPRSNQRHLREFHAAMRRVWALPRALQFEAYAVLIEYLGEPPGVEPEKLKQVRLRAGALADLQRAHQWLGLPDGVAPRGHDYDRAQVELGLLKRHKVIEAWEKWDNAQRALVGEWVPEAPAQRALRLATSGKQRSHETYLAGVRLFVLRPGVQAGGAREYDEFVVYYNDRRGDGDLPLVTSGAVLAAFPGLRWHEVVAAALDVVDPYELMHERAEERMEAARRAAGLVGADVIAGLLGIRDREVYDLAKRDDFPQPVAKVGGARAWDVEDIRAYAAGEPVSRREAFERQHEVLDTTATARQLKTTAGSLIAALYHRRTTVPPPDGRVSERHYWLADTVAQWLVEHGPVGRRTNSG